MNVKPGIKELQGMFNFLSFNFNLFFERNAHHIYRSRNTTAKLRSKSHAPVDNQLVCLQLPLQMPRTEKRRNRSGKPKTPNPKTQNPRA